MPPANPKLYHITHIGNLPNVLNAECIYSDAKRIELGFDCNGIGMSTIKERRLNELIVNCHPPTTVGQYTPFYFCPRSVMLYIIYAQNHPDLAYRDGQDPIVHLEFDMNRVIAWAEAQGKLWAFSDRNAGAYYASFYSNAAELNQINWEAVRATDFRQSIIKEGKQAEFLVFDYIPWELVEKIGVINNERHGQMLDILRGFTYIPQIDVERSWYF